MTGFCAGCGVRVTPASMVGVFVPYDAGAPRALYLLCDRCQRRAEAHDGAMYLAIELRIRATLDQMGGGMTGARVKP